MSFATLVPTAADLADGFKFALSGVLIGAVFAGAAEAVGDWTSHIAQVDNSQRPADLGGSLLLRSTAATAFYMAGDRLLQSVGRAVSDPTDALFFNVAFMLGQPKLIASMVGTAGVVKKHTSLILGLSCCSDCAASGGSCAAK